MQTWALLSVTDKTGIVDLAKGLKDSGYGLLSTGGTAKVLREHGLPVTDVASFTGFPEIMDGRVKTLHPKIYSGLLYDRANETHRQDLKASAGESIDIVVVNLYAFAEEARAKNLPLADAIEHIDIGGPSMLRAAAKNYKSCTVLIDPNDYATVLKELKTEKSVRESTREALAAKVFASVSHYDGMIAAYFQAKAAGAPKQAPNLCSKTLELKTLNELRYGENPHQTAALCQVGDDVGGLLSAEILQGKELSYNNYLDLDAALALASELSPTPSVVIVKHTNPCGAASFDAPLADVYRKALASDPVSAFGGIIALNRTVDEETARLISELFVECIAAPNFSPKAKEVLAAKKNLRLLCVDVEAYLQGASQQLRSLSHGILMQSLDKANAPTTAWTSVTKAKANEGTLRDLRFAMTVAKHVKSNAIVLANAGATIGIGAGQMSRIDALDVAIKKANLFHHDLNAASLASDAFFPFRDCVDTATRAGIKHIVQPGGSVRDQESIDACDSVDASMFFSGERHFKH